MQYKMANIDDLDEDFILCNVCNNEYDEDHRAPKLLPCLHTLCNDCALNSAHGSNLKCALCQEEHQISSDLDFLKDSTMTNMMDMIKLQRKPSSILCSDCPDNNNGNAFCKDCYVFLCKECTSAHKRTQLTRRHTLLTLEELKNAGIGSFTRKEMCSLPGHEDQPFSFYCENEECQKPVCTQCVVGDHSQTNGHSIRSLNEIYEENKLLVERLVGELLSKISGVSSDAKTLESEEGVVETKQTEISKEIDSLFDSLEKLLQNRREKLKQRVVVICEERKNEIKAQLTQLQKCKSDMENSCNYSSRMLVFTNKPEFLQLKDVVIDKLSQMVDSEYETNVPESTELSFDACVEQDRFEEIVQNIGDIRTNFYIGNDKTSPKINGTADVSEKYVLPYRGCPKNPPGKYTTNKHSPVTPTKEIRLVGKPESLKLDLHSNNNHHKPVIKTTKVSPTNENVLGRPLSLKSPVISPTKQPTSLGDFLNGRSFQLVIRCHSSSVRKKESQDLADKDPERQLPKAPSLPPALSPSRQRSPGTPPYTPPVYATQSQIYQTYNTTGSPGIKTPPIGEVTSSSKNGLTSPTTNGKGEDNSYIQNSRKGQSSVNASKSQVVPKLNLYGINSPIKTGSSKMDRLQNSLDINGQTKTGNDVKFPKPKTKSQTVTWNLDQKETNETPKKQNISTVPKLTESSFPEVKQPSPRKPPSDKLIVFGDIACPDFQMDSTSAHHEREVSKDGRTLRNKKTDIFSGGGIDLENSLVQYKGAIGTIPFQEQGKFYYEVDVVYNIQQPLEETWLVFEIGLCRLDDVDMHHTVERHEFARSFYVARYPEDGKLTMEFWHNRDLLNFMPLSDNSAGIEVRITYGFLVDIRRKKWVVVDCNNNKVLHSFDMLDFTEALHPVFGCYNPDLCTVEMTLKTGSEITMIPQCLKQPSYGST
ncbi:E3 ubiquitin-protein ligase TRIM33-like isoform X3 [Mercenaria mercenaria]|uniref:E3 ubiquitin-protein ligase TRIM33-like isoform X3 n=1 Tax=Mercenaria mercenaria TaxID=6596 RepID=UPI00234E8E58|nr:E3 ubiquitin-protein ligase TRIM33-like isoform X3 [Mercenaria mercenaria]